MACFFVLSSGSRFPRHPPLGLQAPHRSPLATKFESSPLQRLLRAFPLTQIPNILNTCPNVRRSDRLGDIGLLFFFIFFSLSRSRPCGRVAPTKASVTEANDTLACFFVLSAGSRFPRHPPLGLQAPHRSPLATKFESSPLQRLLRAFSLTQIPNILNTCPNVRRSNRLGDIGLLLFFLFPFRTLDHDPAGALRRRRQATYKKPLAFAKGENTRGTTLFRLAAIANKSSLSPLTERPEQHYFCPRTPFCTVNSAHYTVVSRLAKFSPQFAL